MINQNKGKKKRIFIIISIVLAMIIIFIAMLILNLEEPIKMNINNIDITSVADGVYVGEGDNNRVRANVSVVVKSGAVTNIEILEHETLLGKKAESIANDVIQKQSLDIEAISSATMSSEVILKAIENALQKGL